jgi:hypothetical protein
MYKRTLHRKKLYQIFHEIIGKKKHKSWQKSRHKIQNGNKKASGYP